MVQTALTLSDDQAEAWDTVSDLLGAAGVDMLGGTTLPPKDDPDSSVFVSATGQSGHPLSRYYDDLGQLWRRGDGRRSPCHDQRHAQVLDDQLLKRLKSRLDSSKKDPKDIDLKDDTDCTICFTDMDKETEALEDCGQCKKYFHHMCITAWKNHNPTCPLCRAPFSGGGKDALAKVGAIRI